LAAPRIHEHLHPLHIVVAIRCVVAEGLHAREVLNAAALEILVYTFGLKIFSSSVYLLWRAEPESHVIHPHALPSVLARRTGHLVESQIVKAVPEPLDVVAILSKVEPGNSVLVLKCDFEPQNLRIEAGRTTQVSDVQIDVGDINRLDHLPSSFGDLR